MKNYYPKMTKEANELFFEIEKIQTKADFSRLRLERYESRLNELRTKSHKLMENGKVWKT